MLLLLLMLLMLFCHILASWLAGGFARLPHDWDVLVQYSSRSSSRLVILLWFIFGHAGALLLILAIGRCLLLFVEDPRDDSRSRQIEF